MKSLSQVQRLWSWWGLAIACCILTTWMISLIQLLQWQFALQWQITPTLFSDNPIGFFSNFALPLLGILLAIWWQSFLYMGLFITAHDAMHGAVYSGNPHINHRVGTIAVLLYALLSYKKLSKSHWQHHRYPASEQDPDFHDGKHSHPLAWYLCFMRQYWSWRSWLGMTLIYHCSHQFFQVDHANLILFWVVPALLSSVQLFYFGTFLPHREPVGGYTNASRAMTIDRSIFWSFITCYHFGYHQEHHEYPQMAWWQLPALVKRGVA